MPLRRFTGSIVWFNRQHGFGSMLVEGLTKQAYVHITEFPPEVRRESLGRGTKCEFFLENARRGLKCVRANVV